MNRVARKRLAKKLSGDEQALTHRIVALLLEYPDDDLLAQLPELREATRRLPARLGEPLQRLIDFLLSLSPQEVGAHYVSTFDHKRRCCPYLTYYAHGDTRNRGVALVKFKQAYRAAGMEIAADELPDHLSVVLEFAATADRAVGMQLLLEHRAGVEVLRLALTDAGSPYADALVAVSRTMPALEGDDREAVAQLAAEGPPAEEVGLDPYAAVPDHEGARV